MLWILDTHRPISSLSPFSKIFEKYLYVKIVDYLFKNEVLYKHQFRFRENWSPELAIILVSNEIIKSIKNTNITCSVFLYLAKAFDTLDPSEQTF